MMKFGRFLQIVVLILLAAGAQPASSALWQWSKTASNNATADATINWSEGMSPSSINDSARAMMARAAEWRDDISGAVTLGGTSTAYTMATNQASGGAGIASPALNGQMLAFVPNVTNGIAPTLTVDSGTAYPLQSAPGVPIASAAMIAGTPYRVSFNLSSLAWVLEGGFGNPYNVPLGGVLQSTIATAPNSNFVVAAGQCISATTYAAYFAAIGSPASGGCAGGQFAVLDARGRALVGLDTLNGSPANRLTTSGVGCGTSMTTMGASCANGAESKNLAIANINAFTPTVASATLNISGNINVPVQGNTGSGVLTAVRFGSNDTSPTAIAVSGATLGGTATVNMNALGSGTAHPTVDPNVAVYIYVRVI